MNNIILNLNTYKIENQIGLIHNINNLSFNIKRLYYIDCFTELNNFRNEYLDINKSVNKKIGFYSNKNFDEIYIILNGEINIKLLDKNNNNFEKKLKKDDILYINSMNWIEYEVLNEKTIILVLGNETIEESKIIKNFEEFISI